MSDLRRRIGRFRISRDLIDNHADRLMAVFEGVLVVRAEMMYAQDWIDYVAMSWHFEPVPICDVAPFYECTSTQTPDGIVVSWKRLDNILAASASAWIMPE